MQIHTSYMFGNHVNTIWHKFNSYRQFYWLPDRVPFLYFIISIAK